MKRILGLLLVCVMTALCFVGCQNNGDESNTTAQQPTATEAPTAAEEPEIPPTGTEKTLKLTGNISGVHVFGKRLYVNRNYLSCDYSGSGIEFVIDSGGGSLKLLTRTDAPCRFQVTVDGVIRQFDGNPYVTVNGSEDIVVSKLTQGKHTVRVIKLTGFEQARASFFSLNFYGTLLTDEAPADREITVEFLGGNAASGLGANGDYTDQDATLAYPYLLASKLGTEYSILALSDNGLLDEITNAYPYANVKKDAETLYDFPTPADVTVIHIGSNGQSADAFTASYKSLLETVREKNGKFCKLVCVYNTSDTVAANAIAGVCAELGGEDAGVFYMGVSIKDSGTLTTTEQQALSDALAPTLQQAIEAEIKTGTLNVGNGDAEIRIDDSDPTWNS